MSTIARRLSNLKIDLGYLVIWQPNDLTCTYFNGKGSEYFQRMCLDIHKTEKMNPARDRMTLIDGDEFESQVTKIMKEVSHMKHAVLIECSLDMEMEREWFVFLEYTQSMRFNRTFKILEKAREKMDDYIDDNEHLLNVKLGEDNVIPFRRGA